MVEDFQECVTMNKLCKTCNQEKSTDNFYEMASGNLEANCKECKKAKCKKRYYANHKDNKSKHAKYKADSRGKGRIVKNIPEKEYNFNYRTENKERLRPIYNAISANRRARILKATPVWANIDEILSIYEKAAEFNMHVDHIIPLKGRLVSGLHVQNNLQLLSPHDNIVKSNKFVEDIV